MMHMQVCKRCLGEGRRKYPMYGSVLSDGKWHEPSYESAQPAVSQEPFPCGKCKGKGYVHVEQH